MNTSLLRISKVKLIFVAALMVALFGVFKANAQTSYYARANGDWNVNTTWSLSSGGGAVGPDIYPVAGDIVYISEGPTPRTVTIPAGFSASCATIYLGAVSATAGSLNLAASSSTLTVSGNVIIYGPTGGVTRSINADGGAITIGGNLELNNGQTAANGNRICRLSITTGNVIVSGNLVFNNIATSSNNQAQIVMSAGAGTFNLAGTFNIINAHGTLTPGTTSAFNFNGSAAGQTIPIGVAAIVYNNLNINNTSSAGATLSAAVTATNVTGNISVQSGTFNNGGFSITLLSAKNFSVSNGATFNLTGTSTMAVVSGGGTKSFGATSTVNYAGSSQSVTAETYGHIIFSGSGTKTLPISTLNIAGNWTNNGVTVNAGTGSVVFQGTTLQTIGGTSSTGFFNMTLNNAAGALLGIDASVANALFLNNGKLFTGAFTLDIANTALDAISGISASNYISGNLQRGIAAGANTYEFPTGTATAYAPVSISFADGTEAGSLKVFTTNGDHPDILNSSFTRSTTVNRYWTLTVVNGLATVSYDATFNWISNDEDPDFDYIYAYVQKYTSGAWSHPTMGIVTVSSAQITGMTAFSDFQVGNGCTNPPSATISEDQLVCAGTPTQIRVDLTGSPNWSYTWSDGTNSGTMTNVSSSPSYFTVTPLKTSVYTLTSITDAVGCNGTTSGSATIITGPAASLPVVTACPGNVVSVPVIVSSFTNVGAISLTMTYDKNVLKYNSYTDNYGMVNRVYADESGTQGVLKISGISLTSFNLDDGDALITLLFDYISGNTSLLWDDSGDGTMCEFAMGAPDYEVYCDTPHGNYYFGGSVSETSLTADFSADNLQPRKNTTVQLTDLSLGGAIGWTWSFDRGTVVYMNGTDNHSPSPQVQFTDGGLYTVSLTVTKPNCTATETKTAYIRAGLPGIWTGTASTDWQTITNWDDQQIPNGSIDVQIGTVTTALYPDVPGNIITTTNCRNITVSGTASLTVKGVLTITDGTNLLIRNEAVVTAGTVVEP